MLCFRKPSVATKQAFLDAQSKFDLTYHAVHGTATGPPAGYMVDLTRAPLGHGPEVFAAGCEALREWKQFGNGWIEIFPYHAPLEVGQPVLILGRSLGLWWLNACKIVRLIDGEEGPIKRFGFAYGTLPDHAGKGEERFLIEWDRRDDSITYEIYAFSRPQRLLSRLGYFWLRYLQKRFGRESSAAMKRAVGAPSGASAGGALKRPEPLETRRI
ncbi:MAG TPA: DUF1990 domain-containing protein [Pirellulales bacterium]